MFLCHRITESSVLEGSQSPALQWMAPLVPQPLCPCSEGHRGAVTLRADPRDPHTPWHMLTFLPVCVPCSWPVLAGSQLTITHTPVTSWPRASSSCSHCPVLHSHPHTCKCPQETESPVWGRPRKTFNRSRSQAELAGCRAHPEECTDQQTVYMTASFLALPLYSPILAPPRIT